MKNKIGVILACTVLFLSVNLQAEDIVECQKEECVNYFNKFKKGAKRGYIQANATLGQFYYVGYGTEKDEDNALKYLNKAAVKGERSSQYLVGAISLIKTP